MRLESISSARAISTANWVSKTSLCPSTIQVRYQVDAFTSEAHPTTLLPASQWRAPYCCEASLMVKVPSPLSVTVNFTASAVLAAGMARRSRLDYMLRMDCSDYCCLDYNSDSYSFSFEKNEVDKPYFLTIKYILV